MLVLILLALPLHADIYDRLSELPRHLRSGGVPRDGIPAILDPVFAGRGAESKMDPAERVIGVSINGENRAYYINLMSRHEIVNDTVGGKAIAVTW